MKLEKVTAIAVLTLTLTTATAAAASAEPAHTPLPPGTVRHAGPLMIHPVGPVPGTLVDSVMGAIDTTVAELYAQYLHFRVGL